MGAILLGTGKDAQGGEDPWGSQGQPVKVENGVAWTGVGKLQGLRAGRDQAPQLTKDCPVSDANEKWWLTSSSPPTEANEIMQNYKEHPFLC